MDPTGELVDLFSCNLLKGDKMTPYIPDEWESEIDLESEIAIPIDDLFRAIDRGVFDRDYQ